MSKTINAVKKLQKEGFTVESNNGRYNAILEGSKEVVEFIDQNGEVICISSRRINDQPDAMTDYFPQTWHDNISQAIRFIDRPALTK